MNELVKQNIINLAVIALYAGKTERYECFEEIASLGPSDTIMLLCQLGLETDGDEAHVRDQIVRDILHELGFVIFGEDD